MEFVLGLPIMLLMVLALEQAHLLTRSRQEMVVATRSGAWNEARNGTCSAMIELAPAALQFASAGPVQCARTSDGGASDDFWGELDRAGSWSEGQLTATVRGVERTALVQASGSVSYNVTNLTPAFLNNSGSAWSTLMTNSYAVPSAVFWTYYDPASTKGYGAEIKRALGQSYNLFPRLVGR